MRRRLQLAYFADSYCFESTARVLAALPAADAAASGAEGPLLTLLLDRTICYPAGGGQPADGGEVRGARGGVLSLRDVRLAKDGVVHHTGVLLPPPAPGAPPPFEPGEAVTLHVDAPRRRLHARVRGANVRTRARIVSRSRARRCLRAQIHSAGHLLDVCMSRCGYPPARLAPAKGVHTPAEAYVEYAGKVPPEEVPPLIASLNAALAAAVAGGGAVAAAELPYDAAAAACGGALPPYIAADATPRVVTLLPGEAGCPCGGTHVDDVARVGACTVTAVRVKKGVTRISYTVEGMDAHGK